MKNLFVVLCISVFTISSYAQLETKVPFSVAIAAHIKKYNIKSKNAYKEQDIEYAEFLFDSLVNNHLVGTYMDNFTMNPIKGDPVKFEELKKPIFLITYATWCVPGEGQVPALNDLVDRFHDQIDFVVLFWDTPEKIKTVERDYSNQAHLFYVDERTNRDTYIINNLKHSLGFPMMYYLDNDKKLLGIEKVVSHHSSETLSNSYSIHFNSLSKGVSTLIANLDLESEDDIESELAIDETPESSEKGKKKKSKRDLRTEEERRIDEEYELYLRQKKIDSIKRLKMKLGPNN
ncbi:redoxin domain-containing protein [Aquimarina sp. ERC-38]|uniref:TlpA family protein disulfide reductase n=1 Tax=Aquimarina sp. ERC-38 TaxID=2949996 RepID=UPI002245AB65|nr:redoxin domain-containing protein [Aquimarina sp. ERC-38]UZO80738.1 redoxin domain-containing protein [Aquimarina sp. ERC-38]